MDINKQEMLKQFGFTKEVQRVREKKCPFCGESVDPTSFRDELSRKEFQISGICQKCQDVTFADPEEMGKDHENPLQG